MLRHANQLTGGNHHRARHPDIKIRFTENTDPVEGDEAKNRLPTVNVSQMDFVQFPKEPPKGYVYGIHLFGEVPKCNYEERQLQRDWCMIKSTNTGPGAAIWDYWPPICTPVVALIEGRRDPVEGMFCEHVLTQNGQDHSVYVFAELLRDGDTTGALLVAEIAAHVGEPQEELTDRLFCLQDINKVYAWAGLDERGIVYKPKTPIEPTDLFVDVKYDYKRDKILAIGLVTKLGTVYYAFDSNATDGTYDRNVKENFLPPFLEVPPGTKVMDLNVKGFQGDDGFQYWLRTVFEEQRILQSELIVHAAFSTDVAIFARLLHLGEGLRIGTMGRVGFDIEYVDTWPTPIKDAVRYNAAWDAVALWHKLGYYRYKVMAETISAVASAPDGEGWKARDKFVKEMAARVPAAVPMGIPTAGFNKEQQDILLGELAKAPRARDYTNMTENNAMALGATAEDLIIEPEAPAKLENGTKAIHPGEILLEEYLKPLGKKVSDFAVDIGVSFETMQALVEEKIPMNEAIAEKLSVQFQTSIQYWTNLQEIYDAQTAKESVKVQERTVFGEVPAADVVVGEKKPKVVVVGGGHQLSAALQAATVIALEKAAEASAPVPIGEDEGAEEKAALLAKAREVLLEEAEKAKLEPQDSQLPEGRGIRFITKEMTNLEIIETMGYDLGTISASHPGMVEGVIQFEAANIVGNRETRKRIADQMAELTSHAEVLDLSDIPSPTEVREMARPEEVTEEAKTEIGIETLKRILKHSETRTVSDVQGALESLYGDCKPTPAQIEDLFRFANPDVKITPQASKILAGLNAAQNAAILGSLLHEEMQNVK